MPKLYLSVQLLSLINALFFLFQTPPNIMMFIGLSGLTLLVEPRLLAPFWMKFISLLIASFVIVNLVK